MSKLILIRHGQSMWNKKNQFTGWVDVPLSKQGVEEALEAGKTLRDIPIDRIFVSELLRAQQTAMLLMVDHHSGKTPVLFHAEGTKGAEWGQIHSEKAMEDCIPFHQAWELNERWYGELQGLNKIETAEKYGKEQVHIWRRSFDVPPPNGESLKMTAERTIPFFKESILPLIEKGENILISAHGNSLRALVMHLENLSTEEVLALEIGTGMPLIFSYEAGSWQREEDLSGSVN